MVCKACKTQFEGNYCPTCGLPAPRQKDLSTPRQCCHCGHIFFGQFCPSCGKSASEKAGMSTWRTIGGQAPLPARFSWTPGKVILTVFVALFLCVGVLLTVLLSVETYGSVDNWNGSGYQQHGTSDFNSDTNSVESFQGIQFEVPGQWEQYEDENGLYYIPSEAMDSELYVMFVASDVPLHTPEGQDFIAGWMEESVEAYEEIHREERTVDFLEGLYLSFTGNLYDNTYLFELLAVHVQGGVVCLIWDTSAYSGVDYSEDIKQIFDSVQMTGYSG